ncbi:permease (plasmid) [Gemmatirosa kalamazoonensis]|uniref:Permease n=1 Tax=Gemmatirosa kalamazoonensis TaxID=861299 RepID=W0RTR5_9BACT|nr:ABC transporter permease [Gemmatirosa kalamazoonensis]AHG93852.1 permease [Gemmatirosa kalamazoonensis]
MTGRSLPDGVRRAFRLVVGGRAAQRQAARDVDDEIAFHLAMRADRLRAAGLSDDEALAAAHRRFGDVTRVAEACRVEDDARDRAIGRGELLGSVWQDARFALRGLVRTPLTTTAALLTLALGVGATTAIFSVVYGVLLRPLPYREPDRLVQLWQTARVTGDAHNPLSVPTYRDWKERVRAFDGTMAYAFNRMTLADRDGTPEQVRGAMLWGDVARVLGTRPLLGRSIMESDAHDPVAVLGEGLWRRRYGADPHIVGRSIRMNGVPHTVVGVMPARFRFGSPDVELWTGYAQILADTLWSTQRGRRFQRVIARLKPGVTPAAAAADLSAVARELGRLYPDNEANTGAVLVPLREELVGDVRPALLVLFGAVGCVLLIACANVAHLLLARATARERELAVRAALGAGRGRVARQLLTESLVLSALGGALGIPLAYVGVRVLARLAGDSVPLMETVRVDASALAFTAAAVAVTGVLVGLAPALRSARRDLASSVREGARGAGQSRRQHGVRGVLVTLEVALSLLLLVGAGTLLQSYVRLRAVAPGVRTDGVLAALVAASPTKYPDAARRVALYDRVAERISAIPGVRAVGTCDCMPPEHVSQSGGVLVEGVDPGSSWPIVQQPRAGAGYFAALGIPVRAGRAFTAADRIDAPPVAVVNETFARRLLGGSGDLARAVGRRITMDGTTWMTVVGVVGDVHYSGLAAPVDPLMYTPFAQAPSPGMDLFVRTGDDPARLVPAVQRALLEIDPELPLSMARPLEAAVLESIAAPRFQTTLITLFGCVALALAVVGVYGVVAYGVTQRQREMGVRVALGAGRARVLRLVVSQALGPVWAGVAIGLLGALAGARVLGRFVYATSVHEPATYVAVAGTLVAVAAAAAYLPARRAAAADPASVLRAD